MLSRYLRCLRRSATSPRRPRLELLSLRFLSKCWDNSSMRRVKMATCTSGEPVSVSWRCPFLTSFCFFRFVSISGIISHSATFCNAREGLLSRLFSYSAGAASTLTSFKLNTSVAFAGIRTVPDASFTSCAPYPSAGGIMIMRSPPSFIPLTPIWKPGIRP